MKSLLASLVLALGLVVGLSGMAQAATTTWKFDMFDPSASTVERKINIEYKVLSINKADTFKVTLFQNDTIELASQDITTDYGGDSGIFSIDIPATGTYKYTITAENNTDNSTLSETKTVNVVDGPAPTVNTVVVNNAAAGGGGGAAAPEAAAAGAAAGGGQVAGATETAGDGTNTGQTGQDGATTDGNNTQGDVLGATNTTPSAANNTGRNAFIAIAAVAAAGAAYYWFMVRPKRLM